jgi:quinol monooxygenase YgiN
VPDEIELTLVTMRFEASDPERLEAVLSRYVVLTRMVAGCLNVDLCASLTSPGRFLVIEKWEAPSAQRAHADSHEMVDMAESCRGIITRAPDIDLLIGLSAHDLR